MSSLECDFCAIGERGERGEKRKEWNLLGGEGAYFFEIGGRRAFRVLNYRLIISYIVI